MVHRMLIVHWWLRVAEVVVMVVVLVVVVAWWVQQGLIHTAVNITAKVDRKPVEALGALLAVGVGPVGLYGVVVVVGATVTLEVEVGTMAEVQIPMLEVEVHLSVHPQELICRTFRVIADVAATACFTLPWPIPVANQRGNQVVSPANQVVSQLPLRLLDLWTVRAWLYL